MPDAHFHMNPGWEKEVVKSSLGALESLGERIKDEAVRLCPVSPAGSNGNPPGFLRDSIYHDVNPDSGVITVGALAEYATYVEMGHRTVDDRWVPAQSFLRAAIYKDRGYGE